jgi:hypothetical protein
MTPGDRDDAPDDNHTAGYAAGDELDDDLETEELPELIHVAEDLNDYLEKERYKQIFEAKEEAADILRQFGNPKNIADSTAEMQLIREEVSGAVISFITEIRRLLEETEQGRTLWEDTEIATISVEEATAVDGNVSTVTPTGGLVPVEHQSEQSHRSRDRHRIETSGTLCRLTASGDFQPVEDERRLQPSHGSTDYYYLINGVSDYLALHDTMASVAYMTDSPGFKRGKQTETVTVDPYPPVRISREVYQQLTRLLSKTGIDVTLGEPDDEAEFEADYRNHD